MSSLLLILDDGERRLLEQDAHYMWIEEDALRVSANPPSRPFCIGHFVSQFGLWTFYAGPGDCPPELRINGRPVEGGEVELPSGRAEARLAAEPFSQSPGQPSGSPRRTPAAAPESPRQHVIGPPGTGADLELDDPSVRPRHATFEVDSRGAWWITAVNGDVLVDGNPVASVTREPGTRFAVGRRVVTVPTGVRGRRGLPVEFRDVTVRRGGRRILDRVSFTLPAGDLVAVTGPEPASTQLLLGLIVGGYRADSGSVRVAGSSRRSDPLARWVPATDDLHGTLTVGETLQFAAALCHEAVTPERIDEVLAWVGLDDRRAAWVRTLDDGDRKRLAIGVELLGRPALLVILESATSFAVGQDHDLMSRLRTIARDTNCTIVVAAGAMSQLEVADTVVVIDRDGRLRHAGPPGRPPASGRQGTWAEFLATLESPAGDRPVAVATLPRWDLVIEPESPLDGLPALLLRQAKLFQRRGPGALAVFGVGPPLAAGVAVLISARAPMLVLVAVLTGLLAGPLDLVTDRGPLTRDRRATGYGTVVAARLAVLGAACAAPLLVVALLAELAGTTLPVVPGFAPSMSHWLELWLVAVAGIEAGTLACAYGRVLRPSLVLLGLFGLAVVLLGSVLLSLGGVLGLLGLTALIAIGAPLTASVLDQRAVYPASAAR
ncbi:FHA domain-containing protein [Actinoplanes sp. CA-142083]|uniref:FHA domain-containing protein n=1 Tax=Actinoplanes sp. CA-142083 TaxID=3239903 RepID=UPI003D8D64B4